MPIEEIKLKYPGGYRGIILQAHNEKVQDEVFLPTDGILVAVNHEGDPDYGSVVVDLTKDNEIASDRAARLQTAWRVARKPLFQPNTLALQLNQEGQGKGFGGYVIDIPHGGAAGVEGDGGRALGRLSHHFGGPLVIGGNKDKHYQGNDADKQPIGPVHLWTSSNFYRDAVFDGPLRFETAYEEGQDDKFPYPVHLGWTGGDWAWYVKLPIRHTPTPPIPWRPPIPSRPTKFPDPQQPGRPSTPTPGSTRRPVPPPFPPVETPGHVRPSTPTVNPRPALETTNEVATPGVLARPQTSNQRKIDLARMVGALGAAAAAQFAQTPISGQMMAFGAQGGTKDTAYPGSEVRGASGDPWMYTQKPGKSKFYGGTCPGGFVILPPEVQAGDDANGFVPPNIELSQTYFVCGPNAWFGAGVPDLVDGSIISGWDWGMDTENGDLLFRAHVAGEDPVTAIKFELMTGDFSWKSGTNFWGTFVHTNAGDQDYFFPDASGFVLVCTIVLPDTSGATATLGGIGNGPSSAAQAAWLPMNIGGSTYYVPAWQ